MTFEEVVNDFSERVKVQVEIQDDMIMLEIDDMPLAIINSPAVDSIVLSGQLGEPPPEKLENLYKALLEANFNFSATVGATVSLDPSNGNFILCRILPLATITGDSFFSAVESFVNVMTEWIEVIANYRGEVRNKKDVVEETIPNELNGNNSNIIFG